MMQPDNNPVPYVIVGAIVFLVITLPALYYGIPKLFTSPGIPEAPTHLSEADKEYLRRQGELPPEATPTPLPTKSPTTHATIVQPDATKDATLGVISVPVHIPEELVEGIQTPCPATPGPGLSERVHYQRSTSRTGFDTPTSPTYGPLRMDDRFGRCFARAPEGAAYALANALMMTSFEPATYEAIKITQAKGRYEGKRMVLLNQPFTGEARAMGYTLGEHTDTTQTVTVYVTFIDFNAAMSPSQTEEDDPYDPPLDAPPPVEESARSGAFTCTMVWEDNTWRANQLCASQEVTQDLPAFTSF